MKVATSEDKQRLEEKYRGQLKEKDEKLKELRKKEKYFQKVEKLKSREEDINRKLKSEIDHMKAQKVVFRVHWLLLEQMASLMIVGSHVFCSLHDNLKVVYS